MWAGICGVLTLPATWVSICVNEMIVRCGVVGKTLDEYKTQLLEEPEHGDNKIWNRGSDLGIVRGASQDVPGPR